MKAFVTPIELQVDENKDEEQKKNIDFFFWSTNDRRIPTRNG